MWTFAYCTSWISSVIHFISKSNCGTWIYDQVLSYTTFIVTIILSTSYDLNGSLEEIVSYNIFLAQGWAEGSTLFVSRLFQYTNSYLARGCGHVDRSQTSLGLQGFWIPLTEKCIWLVARHCSYKNGTVFIITFCIGNFVLNPNQFFSGHISLCFQTDIEFSW